LQFIVVCTVVSSCIALDSVSIEQEAQLYGRDIARQQCMSF